MAREMQQESLTGQVAATMHRLLDWGELGHPLPPERQLAQLLGASRVTMRRALAMLEEQKVIRREQGRGTYSCSGPALVDAETLARQDESFVAVLVTQNGPVFNPHLTPWTWHVCRALAEQPTMRDVRVFFVNDEHFLNAASSFGKSTRQLMRGFIAPTHKWTGREYDAAMATDIPFVGIGRTSRGMYWNIIDLKWEPGLTQALDDIAPDPDDRVFIPIDRYPKEVDRQVWLQDVLQELDKGGVPADRIVVGADGMFEPQGYLAMRSYLREHGMPTLVMADFDLTIAGAYRALAAYQERDSSAPNRRIRFLGGADMKICQYLDPTLSTLRSPFEDVAADITNMLAEQHWAGRPVGTRYVKATYVRRESSGRGD